MTVLGSVLIIAIAGLVAQYQHYAFLKTRKADASRTEIEELKTAVAALKTAQGFKR